MSECISVMSKSVSPSSKDIHGMWGSAANDVWAVGDGGEITHYDGTAWTPPTNIAPPPNQDTKDTNDRTCTEQTGFTRPIDDEQFSFVSIVSFVVIRSL